MQIEPVVAGEFVSKIVPLINQSKNTIDVCVFDWRWYPNDPGSPCQKFNQAIVQAVKRGVKIRAIVNSASVAQTLKNVGVNVKHHLSAHLLHLKMLVIDDKIVITGSHNYTQSAFSANYELSVILNEVLPNSVFSQFFVTLWQS